MAQARNDYTTPVHHIMCPPRMSWETFNQISISLTEIGYMAEIGGELVQGLYGEDGEDYFRIPRAEGNRLAFAVFDILDRLDELSKVMGRRDQDKE